jgi:thiol:disulfide interchange protein
VSTRTTNTAALTGAAVVLLLVPTALGAGGIVRPRDALAERNRIAWLHDEHMAIAESLRSGKPLLIDFRAEWCAACKMMDRHTWADTSVQREIAMHFVPLSLDLTTETDANQELARKYDIAGLPTIVLVSCSQSDKRCAIPGEGPARLIGYAAPAEMLERLRAFEQRPASD